MLVSYTDSWQEFSSWLIKQNFSDGSKILFALDVTINPRFYNKQFILKQISFKAASEILIRLSAYHLIRWLAAQI